MGPSQHCCRATCTPLVLRTLQPNNKRGRDDEEPEDGGPEKKRASAGDLEAGGLDGAGGGANGAADPAGALGGNPGVRGRGSGQPRPRRAPQRAPRSTAADVDAAASKGGAATPTDRLPPAALRLPAPTLCRIRWR